VKHLLTFNTAGLRFYNYFEYPANLVGLSVTLVSEPTNPYDEHAIKVMLTQDDQQIGHVPRNMTGVIHEAWRLGKKFEAKITNHYPRAVVVRVMEIEDERKEFLAEPIDIDEDDGLANVGEPGDPSEYGDQ
jgi:hypothetical protein